MKKLIAFLALLGAALSVAAQVVCTPSLQFGRIDNPDGTVSVGARAPCETPDPNPWAHTYVFTPPSIIEWPNGFRVQCGNNWVAFVVGANNPIRFSPRLVTVDAASLTDANGNSVALVKTDSSGRYPIDQWTSQTLLSSGLQYSFAANGRHIGTDTVETDELVVDGTCTPAPLSGGGGDD